MSLSDLTRDHFYECGLVALGGLTVGILAIRVVDLLPAQYGVSLVEHRTHGRARTRRNLALLFLNPMLAAWLAVVFVARSHADVEQASVDLAVDVLLGAALMAAACIDFEHMILPNEITLGGTALALATSCAREIGFHKSLIGAFVGVALTYVPSVLYKYLRGRSGMGLGDAKLALLAGAWLGPEGAGFVVLASAVQSAVCGMVMHLSGATYEVPASVEAEIAGLRAKSDAGDEDARALLADDPMAFDVDAAGETSRRLATMRLPMGPFLVASCLEFLVARGPLLSAVASYFSPR